MVCGGKMSCGKNRIVTKAECEAVRAQGRHRGQGGTETIVNRLQIIS